MLIWDLGEDEEGQPIRIWDFVRIPRDREGYPVINEKSNLYQRLTALYGKPVDPMEAELEIVLPEEYDSPEGLNNLPTFDEGKEEGFRPVTARSIKLNGEELLGKEALVTVAEKNERSVVQSVSPKPQAKRPKVKRLEAEAEAAGAPL